MYTLEKSKRGPCHNDDKLYVFAHLASRKTKRNTDAFSHKHLAGEEQLIGEIPDARETKLLVKRHEQRYLKQEV